MKAVVLREVGGDLTLEDVPDAEGENVVDVRAAGVNFADILIRRGQYPQMPELPHVLGNEVAGDLGGRRVVALPRHAGGYAERVDTDPLWTFDLPDSASYAAGAAFLTTYLTAYIPLHHQVRVRAGTTVLVHAGSGGVGSAAIQLAKQLGAHVIATASSDEKRAYAREQGADEAVGYDELDSRSVDVVIDPVGGEAFTRSLAILKPLGNIVAIGFTGGLWLGPQRPVARGTQRWRAGALPRPADEARPAVCARLRQRTARDVGAWRDRARSGRDVPARRRVERACVDRVAEARREGGAGAVKALITGGEGGLGRAMRAKLESEGYEVESLDLVNGFDVTDPAAWERVEAVDLACLNAGILTDETDITKLTDDQYRHAVSVNVDGVVYGVRRLAQVMDGGMIVATASLAGLVGMPLDSIYSLTKHAVVGFVRSIAPQIDPIKINAVCPGIADTPMLDMHDQRATFAAAGFPLLHPDDVADAMWLAATSEGTGECWFVQPGRESAPFRFANIPGPRSAGETVGLPPIAR